MLPRAFSKASTITLPKAKNLEQPPSAGLAGEDGGQCPPYISGGLGLQAAIFC
jgi:hypothetical protein